MTTWNEKVGMRKPKRTLYDFAKFLGFPLQSWQKDVLMPFLAPPGKIALARYRDGWGYHQIIVDEWDDIVDRQSRKS